MAMQLRQSLLAADPASLGLTPENTGGLWALLMEMGFADGFATLVTVADGTISMYFIPGGGMIGIGEHVGPRQTGQQLLAAARQLRQLASPAPTCQPPSNGMIHFHFLTFDGVFTAAAKEKDLADPQAPLSVLFRLGHEIITQARLIDQQRKRK